MKHVFRKGYNNPNKLDANVAARELKKVASKYGAVTPDTVLEAASDPDNPLHAAFTWDDSKAAVAWRKQEARMLVKAIVTVKKGRHEQLYYNVRISKNEDINRAYMVLDDVARNRAAMESAEEIILSKIRGLEMALTDLQSKAEELGLPSRRYTDALSHLHQMNEGFNQPTT